MIALRGAIHGDIGVCEVIEKLQGKIELQLRYLR
jgi:hypothetical protein